MIIKKSRKEENKDFDIKFLSNMEQRHIILIAHNGEKTWESFNTEDEALEYADKLHEQFEGIETIYSII